MTAGIGVSGRSAGRAAPRRGFTLIEVLMVVGIVGMMVSLLLPAAMSAREAGRRLQCMSNLRQVGLAMVSEATRRGRFPASGNFSAVGPEQYHSWVLNVLGDLDQQDIVNSWTFGQPWSDSTNSRNRQVGQTHLGVLACPSDFSVVPGRGNLSYVVNGGFGWTVPVDCPIVQHWNGTPTPVQDAFDFNGDGMACSPSGSSGSLADDRRLYLQTGLFFIENYPYGTGTARHHSLSSVTDGASNTIMISENVRAGYDPYANSGWASPWPTRTSFLLSGYVCQGSSCKAGNVDYRRANDPTRPPYSFEAINASLDQAEGEAPWPSSLHAGGVNVAMCDGSVHLLRQTIDGAVYAALVSPQGMRIRGPLAQVITGEWSE